MQPSASKTKTLAASVVRRARHFGGRAPTHELCPWSFASTPCCTSRDVLATCFIGTEQPICVQTSFCQAKIGVGTRRDVPGQSVPIGSRRSKSSELTAPNRSRNTAAARSRLRRRTNIDVGLSQPQRGNGFRRPFWYSSTMALISAPRSCSTDSKHNNGRWRCGCLGLRYIQWIENPTQFIELDGAPYGNRTHVLALRGPRPGPLDEGSAGAAPRRGLV